MFRTIPEGMPLGSAVANLSILGYDPGECFEGRGVLEAANQGIDVKDDEVVFRCNFICVENERIKSHSAGHITDEESAELIKELNEKLGSEKVRFYAGLSYRNIMVLKGKEFSKELNCVPPHDIPGKEIEEVAIKGDSFTATFLYELAAKAHEILEKHPINIKRAEQGKDMANHIWLWGCGKKPEMKTFHELYGVKGAVISAVDLVKGLGIYAGLDVVNVKGATGLYDTNYEGKADACVKALEEHDFVYVHVEAADEAGHEGNLKLKIKCIEDFDKRLLGRVLDNVKEEVCIAVLPDHPTPVKVRTHVSDPVPFLIYKPAKEIDDVEEFDEESCKKGGYGLIKGNEFISALLER
jgi:2,3-bisphosphoglycerate-independent phosphoglycerate mutase